MWSENQDKNNWRTALGELESLSGESFDKNKAWEQLHNRLSRKKRTNKPLIYWMAAAVAFGFMLFFLFQQNEKNTEDNQQAISKTTGDKNYKKMHYRVEENPKVQQDNESNPTRIDGGSIAQHPKKITVTHQPDVKLMPDTTLSVAIQASENLSPKIESLNEPVTQHLPKRKLRVVHVNELEQKDDDKNQFARAAQQDSRILNGGMMPNTPFNTYAGDEIIKIKLSSNN